MCHAYCCHPVACALLKPSCLLRRGRGRWGHHARPRGRGGRGGGPGAALLPQRQQVGIGAPAQLQEGAACICPWPLQPADVVCQAVICSSAPTTVLTHTRRADPLHCPEPRSFPAAHVALRLEQIAAGQWPGRGEASSSDRAARALIKVRNRFDECPLVLPGVATPARAWPLQPASSHSCEHYCSAAPTLVLQNNCFRAVSRCCSATRMPVVSHHQ